MNSVIFSLESVGVMLVESYRDPRNCETGGILVGPRNQKGIVTDAITSSEHADRNPSTYLQTPKDVEILNQQLKEFHEIGYDFKGYFHKHPFAFSRLSGEDLHSCAEILRSPNYKINNYFLMCIITATSRHDSPLFSYVVTLAEDNSVTVTNTEVNIMPKRCIQECLECFKEDYHENNDPRHTDQSSKGKGERSNIRHQRRGHNNIKLSDENKRPQKNGNISKRQETINQNLKE